jgi:hypothetical protein
MRATRRVALPMTRIANRGGCQAPEQIVAGMSLVTSALSVTISLFVPYVYSGLVV